jgi:RNA polymerase sigma-70 factor (ECF subfamily)
MAERIALSVECRRERWVGQSRRNGVDNMERSVSGGRKWSNTAQSDASVRCEDALLARLVAGERDAFETLMRSNNRRLFRVARAIVSDDAEAEDAVQAGYLAAFLGVAHFAGRSSLATWLTRIVINEALARRRARLRDGRYASVYDLADQICDRTDTPEDTVSIQQLTRLTETAIDALPATYRLVLILRQVEGLSGEETAASLGVSEEAVRVRLHRARAMLREQLPEFAPGAKPFGFAGERCNRIVERVLAQVATGELAYA